MTPLTYYSFLLILNVFLSSFYDKDPVKLNARDIYHNCCKGLKPLNPAESQFLLYKFDNVSGWDEYRYRLFSYPLDTLGKRSKYEFEKEKYLSQKIIRLKLYSFPIKLNSKVLNCILTESTDSNMMMMYYARFLEVYYYNQNEKASEPVNLLRYNDWEDGFSKMYENSDCTILNEKEIESRYIYSWRSKDLEISEKDSIPESDTVIIKMMIYDDMRIDILSEYDSKTKINK